MKDFHVIMFQPRFAAKVARGYKTTTIRLPRKRAIKPGDVLSLRVWKGKPYRSKQQWIRSAVCTKVENFTLRQNGTVRGHVIGIDHVEHCSPQCDFIAHMDGFADGIDMTRWFLENHTLPFEGVRIHWNPNG